MITTRTIVFAGITLLGFLPITVNAQTGTLYYSNANQPNLGPFLSELNLATNTPTVIDNLGNQYEGVAADSNGNLFTLVLPGTIEEFDSHGNETRFAQIQPDGTGNRFGYGLAIDSSNDVFAANYYAGEIEEFTPGGAESVFATISNPVAVAASPLGYIYASGGSNNQLYMYSATGSLLGIINGLGLHAMGVNNQGDIVVGLFGNVDVYSPFGGLLNTYADGLAGAESVATDPQGDIFVDGVTSGGQAASVELNSAGVQVQQLNGGTNNGFIAYAVPEPTSAMLLLAGLAVLGFRKRE